MSAKYKIIAIVSAVTVLLFICILGNPFQYKKPLATKPETKLSSFEINTINLYDYNKDYERRDEILKLKVDWENDKGGTASFEHLDIVRLKLLLDEKFIDPSDQQNEAPTVKEFYEFMLKYPKATVFGYAVSPKRNDYRVSIEGVLVLKEDVTPIMIKEFNEFSKNADEVSSENGLFAWWD